MNNITRETIQKYVQKLHDRGESNDVIERKLQAVKKFVNWGKTRRLIKPQMADGLTKVISAEQRGTLRGITQKESAGLFGKVYFRFHLQTYKIRSFIGLIRRIPLLNIILGSEATPESDSGQARMTGSQRVEPRQAPLATEAVDKRAWQQLISELGLQHYIGFIVLLIFVAALGAGIYNQFFKKTETPLAYPTALTRSGRIISFQGRLTDSLGNPIVTATNVQYKLYNVSSGGSALYSSGTCATTPDQDGIFSSLIGQDCGAEIGNAIFTENANVYLGVTVGTDSEMTPRQQIANVGYAINAETLQGLPPGAETSNVPYINSAGDLLMAAASPGVRSINTSANFQLSSANAVTLTSASTGDIVLQATESGTLKFRTGGTTDTYTRILVDNGGNVGIGTTSPASALQVSGTAWLRGGTTTTGLFVNSSGNVGIGTTSPAAGNTLHVEGQCVTGDTLLPMVREIPNSKFQITNKSQIPNNKQSSNYNNQNSKQFENWSLDIENCLELGACDLEFSRIDKIKGGEYVLSLNEDNGTFEWQKVEKTLDMGVQEVYQLVTEGGKRIETTGNHPYLSRRSEAEADLVRKKSSLRLFGGPSVESDIHQQNSDGKKRRAEPKAGDDLFKKFSAHNSNFSSNLIANHEEIIKPNTSYVNTFKLKETKLGVTKRTANQVADRLVNSPEKNLNLGIVNESLIKKSLTNSTLLVNDQWVKVIYLKEGDKIATLDGFEKIVSIKITGRKHVYDLQIENTHNFVANGIVAHNTYISGNLGIGTTSPSQKLEVSGNIYANAGQIRLGNFDSAPTTIGAGSMYYDSTATKVYYYNGSTWTEMGSGAGGDSYWGQTTGALYPLNSTIDLLIGGQATSSAKFAFINVNSGTPTASMSGNLALASPTGSNPATALNVLNGGTFNLQTSVGGDAGLSSRLFVTNAGNIGIGTTNPASFKLQVTGHAGPDATNTYDLGSSALQWQNVYGQTLYQNGTAINDSFVQLQASSPGTQQTGNLNISGISLAGYFADTSNSAYGLDPAGTSNFGGYSLKTTGGSLLAADSGNVGIGTTSPVSKFEVSGTNTGKALAIFNETGGNDIFTSSASGIPRVTVSNSGNISLSGNIVSAGGSKYLPIFYEGQTQINDTFFDGFTFGKTVTITRVTLSAKTAPTGSDFTVDLTKNGSAQSHTATLAAGSNSQSTDITDIAYTSTDTFGLKVTGVGSTEAGRDLTVIVHYREQAGDDATAFIAIPYEGTAVTNDTAFDGLYPDAPITITKVSIAARNAPTGSALTVDLTKGGSVQSRTATLAAGATYQQTDITDTSFSSGELLGIKITGIGSSVAGEGLTIILHYTHDRGDTGTQYLPFLYAGVAQSADDVLAGWPLDESTSITSTNLFVRTTPSGANLTVDLIKNGSVESRTMTLTAGATYQQTNIKDDAYTTSDTLGLRITGIGSSGSEGESIVTVLHTGQGGSGGGGFVQNRTLDGQLVIGSGNYSTLSGFSFNDGSTYISGNLGVSGTAYLEGGTIWTSADLAENYPAGEAGLAASELVTLTAPEAATKSATASGAIYRARSAYDPKLLGIVSTKPAGILNGTTGNGMIPVALVGRVPVKIAPDSPPIEVGDFLTSSSTYPGMAQKATKAGYTVGKALESWTPCAPVIPVKTGIQTKDTLRGDYRLDPLLRGDDNGTSCGSPTIEAFVHLGFYDPDLMLTSTGDLVIARREATKQSQNEIATASATPRDDNTATNSAEFVYDGNLENSYSQQRLSLLKDSLYKIELKTGVIIDRVGAFSEAAIANLKAGLIETENAIVNNTLAAKNIVAENVSSLSSTIYHLSSNSLSALDATIERLTVNQKITSPVVETKDLIATGTAQLNTIATNEIKPQEKDLVIDLNNSVGVDPRVDPTDPRVDPTGEHSGSPLQENDKGPLARVIIRGLEGKTVATIDAAGNASFSGQLTASSVVSNQLSVNSATVSGTLAANEAIISGTLTASKVEAENIKALEERLNVILSEAKDLATEGSVNDASLDSSVASLPQNDSEWDINQIQALLAEIKNQPLPDLTNQTNLSKTAAVLETSPSGTAAVNPVYGQGSALSLQDLTVTGNTNLYTASVANSLTTGSLLFQDNTILSLTWELKLSALSTINLFDGAVMIAKDGTITTKGALIAQGGIRTNEIRALKDSGDVNVILSESEGSSERSERKNASLDSSSPSAPQNDTGTRFNIQNQLGQTVASIDASGSARFSTLALDKYLDATTSAAVIAAADNFAKNGLYAPAIETTTASAGLGILPENSSEVIIYNENIKENSLIYLTPSSDSPSPTLTVVKKEACPTNSDQFNQLSTNSTKTCKPYFKVAIDSPTPKLLQFNWLIIN